MIKWNIWENEDINLELHEDERGKIKDIFYKKNINHVAIIDSKANVVRGNHFHKSSTQYILILSGGLEYWYKNAHSSDESKYVNLYEGDIVSTPPNEIHALNIHITGCRFMAFSEGLRGGKDYESDTFRIDPSIINK